MLFIRFWTDLHKIQKKGTLLEQNIVVVVIYTQTDDSAKSIKDEFENDLICTLRAISRNKEIIQL